MFSLLGFRILRIHLILNYLGDKFVKRKKIIRLMLLGLLLAVVAGYLVWQNNAIGISYFEYDDTSIPEAFDGYKIVQVSDLHNKDFGNQLIDKVTAEEPDIIVVTGDVIDRNRTNIPVAVEAMEEMVDIAPVYFVTGNHEIASGVYADLQVEMDRIGVIDLDNAFDILEIDGMEIGLIGIEDPLFLLLEDIEEIGSLELLIQSRIKELIEQTNTDFNMLLSHRAELIGVYSDAGADLTFTGHAHGGQIRLPLIEGIFAPSQGFFPEYTSGVYQQNDTTMIVSRGLGNSIFPLRINNRPELVVITLQSAS